MCSVTPVQMEHYCEKTNILLNVGKSLLMLQRMSAQNRKYRLMGQQSIRTLLRACVRAWWWWGGRVCISKAGGPLAGL